MKICVYPALIAASGLPIEARFQERAAASDDEHVVIPFRQSESARESIHPVTAPSTRSIEFAAGSGV